MNTLNKLGFVVIALAALVAMPALALDLHEARSSGQVAETPEGFIKAVKPSPEVDALVAEVNAKRRAEYQRISKENGQPVDVVGKLAAPQIQKNMK